MHETRFALKAHVIVERESDADDIVLIDSRSGRMSACNETASVVIALLQKGTTIVRLVEALVSRFGVADDVATRDINAVLDMLAADGSLETSE